MKLADAWTVHVASGAVVATGLIYGWMRYLVRPVDEFAVVNHPWQPLAQHAHVWAAPLLVFAVGLIWRGHVWGNWRRRERSGRRSGAVLALVAFPMIESGYALQTAVAQQWRTAWIALHLIASALWLAGMLWHVVARRRPRTTRPPADPAALSDGRRAAA
ncbi:MAG: hypothetical protein AAGN46_15985 [Acidobacteriota bacterium]